jgi:hypothetical protein
MNCRRAMVSLIDKETQYFVAESSKTLNLEDKYVYIARYVVSPNIPPAPSPRIQKMRYGQGYG